MLRLVLGWRVQQIVVGMILSSKKRISMLQIHDVSTVPAPILGNSSPSPPVSFGVIARNAQHNDQDVRQVLINLAPFF